MDATALWQRYQKWLYFHEGLGFYLDVSRMGFDDNLVTKLEPLFDKAFADMAELEKGAIANPDEQRMVGHYWLRNPDLAPTPELTQEIVNNIEKIEVFAEKIHTGAIHPPKAPRFTDIISIGIGGSALGPSICSSSLGYRLSTSGNTLY